MLITQPLETTPLYDSQSVERLQMGHCSSIQLLAKRSNNKDLENIELKDPH